MKNGNHKVISGVSEFFEIYNGTITLKRELDERKFERPQPLTVAIADLQGRKKYLSFIVRLHHLSTPDNETIVTKIKETTVIGTKLITLSPPQRALMDTYYSLIKNACFFILLQRIIYLLPILEPLI